MAKDNIDIVWDSRDDAVVNTLRKMHAGMSRLEQQANRAGRAGGRAGRQTASSFDRATASLTNLVKGIVGIGAVVQTLRSVVAQVRREIENMRQRQTGAAERQLEFAPAIAQATRNAAGFFGRGKAVQKVVENLNNQLGFGDPTEIANALGGALSSIGPTNKREAEIAKRAVVAAFRFIPTQPGTAKTELASIAGKIAKQLKVSPEQAIGLIQQTGNLANIREAEPLIKNLGPAILNLLQFGYSPQEAASLLAATSQGIGDVEGAMTRTATVNLSESLQRFNKLRGKKQSPVETIREIQKDSKLRELFLEGGALRGPGGKRVTVPAAKLGKGIAKPTIRSLLGVGDAAIARQFEKGIPQIGGAAAQTGAYRKSVADVQAIPAVQTALFQKAFQSATANVQLVDIAGGRSGITRQGLEEFLKASGEGALSRSANRALLDAETGGVIEIPKAVETLRRRARNIQQRLAEVEQITGRHVDVDPFSSVNTRQNARSFDRLADTLEKLNATFQRAEKVQQQANAAENNVPKQQPAAVLGRIGAAGN